MERIDKWLWTVRVFKTRTLATDACKKGHVTVGPTIDSAIQAKPSREIKPGEIIHVKKSPIIWSFRVKALTNNRLGAKLVPEYMENITEKSQLDILEMIKIRGFVDRRKGLGRPTKKEGRELSKFNESLEMEPFFDSELAEYDYFGPDSLDFDDAENEDY